MDWTAGYASDIEYTAGFYQQQSPLFLHFASAINGYEPVALDRPFTYCELGFGRGVTVNVLAAANPQGRFYAADFNPAHVAGATDLAAAAGLNNLTLLENSFAELAEGKVANLPPFDFITLHGIYTWVNAENRRHIVNFLERYLKPGGIVYLSYNAMPGWSSAVPLQRFLVEYADLHPNRSDVQVKEAAQFVDRMVSAKAACFTGNPAIQYRLDMLKTASPQYLVHEYMHKHWQPLYHLDVARELAGAKLEFVGSADLPFAFEDLYLSADRKALLDTISDTPMRETAKDYLLNTSFRKDVFIRGARRIGPQRQIELLSRIGIALLAPPPSDSALVLKLPFGEVAGREDIYRPIVDALVRQPHTLSQLAALPALRQQNLMTLAQAAALLTASGYTSLYLDGNADAAVAGVRRMNRALARQTTYGGDFHVLSSALTASGVTANFVEQAVYLRIAGQDGQIDREGVAQSVFEQMITQGRRLVKDGKPIETDDALRAEVGRAVTVTLEHRLPVWRQLGII
jgi:SAM-dependent methyltransferase